MREADYTPTPEEIAEGAEAIKDENLEAMKLRPSPAGRRLGNIREIVVGKRIDEFLRDEE